jgi:putative glycosyltransferase (TIGR04348 family)
MAKPHIVIISPYLKKANNGNWQTAWRWSRFLSKKYKVTLADEWDGCACNVMIALHARRSASSISAFAAQCPEQPLIVVLTGTDLYRDIFYDNSAKHSLKVATRLIVLQPAGLALLDEKLQRKTQVVYQSAPSLKIISHIVKVRAKYFDVVMIGHLREEKDPATYMHAVQFLKSNRVRMTHIGGVLDAELGVLAEKTQLGYQQYLWLGNRPHAETRQRLKRSHLMVITSRMEGGANVIIEAVTSGVAILASDISGNRGMLGDDYAGYFPVGDSVKLAQLIDQAASDENFYSQLQKQCAERASLFSPVRESETLLKIVAGCIL